MKQIQTRARSVPSWAVLAICCAAQFMVVLDIAIVNVALPEMRSSLHMSVAGEQWVVNAYTLTFAGFLMLGGRAADLVGRRRIFLLGLFVFTLFSLIGGFAQSGTWLITARAVQGLGGAILAPTTLSILVTAFPGHNERRKALGAWSATAASGAAVGVLAGGILTSVLDWRWVFFVNVPIGVALLAGAWVALERDEAPAVRRTLDLTGALTVTGGLAVVVYGIVSTDVHPWGSLRTVVTLAVGLALLAVFFTAEARFARDPLIPLSIFKRRSLSVANGIAVVIGAAIFGTYFFLSLLLQNVDRYSALRTGLAFLPIGVCTLIGALVASRVVPILGARRQLVIGMVVAAVGLLWLAQIRVGEGYLFHVLGPLALVGIGTGLSFVPMTLSATAGVPAHEAGLASGLINTTRQVGGALGLAIMATVATTITTHDTRARQSLAVALTGGYRSAFAIGGAGLVVGALLATLLPKLAATATEAPATANEAAATAPRKAADTAPATAPPTAA